MGTKQKYVSTFKFHTLLASCLLFLLGCSVHGNIISSSVSQIETATASFTTIDDGVAPSGYIQTRAVVTDASGNIYMTGETMSAMDGQTLHGSQDFFITKYNSTGVRQWTVQDGAASDYISVYAIVLDSLGNIYVAGSTDEALDGQTLHGDEDLFITKYNSSGVRQWTVEDGVATTGTTGAFNLVIDSTNSLYATGLTSKALDGQTLHGTNDFFITKYNSSGTRQWTVEDGAASGNVIGYGIGLDTSGFIYVTGTTSKALDGQTLHGLTDFFITQYNSSGVRQWTVEDGPSSGLSASVTSLTIDTSGFIYVVGSTSGALDGQTKIGSEDFFITKYNSSGTRQWTVEDGSSSGTSYANWVVTDTAGFIYVTGETTNPLDGQTQHGIQDLFITKYSSAGLRQWTIQDGGPSGSTFANAITIDTSGYLYICGEAGVSLDGQPHYGSMDLFLSKYNSSGVQAP